MARGPVTETPRSSQRLRPQRHSLPTCNFRFSYHFSEKETRLQEQRWALKDQINDLQKQTYGSTTIADQLKEFVQNFPQLQAGERKLLIDSLIKLVEIGQNKRVILTLRSPFHSFGYFSPSIAPRVIEPDGCAFVVQLSFRLEFHCGREPRPPPRSQTRNDQREAVRLRSAAPNRATRGFLYWRSAQDSDGLQRGPANSRQPCRRG